MREPSPSVQVTVHRPVLESIFDECNYYNWGDPETGGRLIGTYETDDQGCLSITVLGVIEPGPNARRSPTSFFQDGDYQEKVFRAIEAKHPKIEHLGNWHTHHVNGYPTLSEGDWQTYHNHVNHKKHNTNFFYALLVTARNGAHDSNRYRIKHFVVFRGSPAELEIPPSHVRIVDIPAVGAPGAIAPREISLPPDAPDSASGGRPGKTLFLEKVPGPGRAKDSDFFKDIFPGLRVMLSKKTAGVYWRGSIDLVDGSPIEVIAAEVEEDGQTAYIVLTQEPAASTETGKAFADRRFHSAAEAVVLFERAMNREVFRGRTPQSHEGQVSAEDFNSGDTSAPVSSVENLYNRYQRPMAKVLIAFTAVALGAFIVPWIAAARTSAAVTTTGR